ncbi:MAG: sensor histidine kinase, partial [Verrucomicrobiota bacterium]
SDLKIISVNRAFEQFFRKKEALVKGQFLEIVLNMWWSGNQLRNELEKVLVNNQPLEDIPIEVQPHGLGERTLLLNAQRLNQKERAPAFILVALQDITDRQQAETQLRLMNEELERRVAARTEALQKSYKQMESFCYSIAHDLRAPLRSMKSFSDLLIARFAENLGKEGQDFTMRIQQSAERMDLLIKDLLDYGQLNTIHLPREEVSLLSLLKDILATMEPEISHKHAAIECATDLPPVCGHRIVLQVVLTNLLSNALKFVPPGHQPKVSIRAEDIGVRTRVWVEDNGIGIAPDDQQRIFGVFQRLHSNQRYPGTGIGLALVQKGLERIGGRVGVESTPGEGSRFWIELLKPENLSDQPSMQG